jgi:hypothetical protein
MKSTYLGSMAGHLALFHLHAAVRRRSHWKHHFPECRNSRMEPFPNAESNRHRTKIGIRSALPVSDSKVRYITSLKRGDMGIRGKIH